MSPERPSPTSRFEQWGKQVARRVFALRLRGNAFHRALYFPYQMLRFGRSELSRILFYQPMFESLCEEVGDGLHLEMCPDSKLPVVWNASLKLGQAVRLSARTTLSGARNAPTRPVISIGDHSYVGDRCVFRAGTGIRMGRYCLLSTNVLLCGDPGHPSEPLARRTQPAPREALGFIDIGDDVWMGYNVSVLGNVKIGDGAIVGANSVVTKDVPPYCLVAGNPAKVVRTGLDGAPPAPDTRNVLRVPGPLFEAPPEAVAAPELRAP